MKQSLKNKPPQKSTRDLFKQLYKAPKVFKTRDYAPRKEMFTVARKELAAYAFLCRQQEAREWIEQVLQVTFAENAEPKADDPEIIQRTYKSDLFPPLRDGMHLCHLINVIYPDSVSKIKDSTGKPFLMLENINFFLDACRKMKIPEHKLFMPLDLLERKNMPRVVYCLHEFARVAYEEFGIGLKIVDKTGKIQFSEDEIAKAQRDLDEYEQMQQSPSMGRKKGEDEAKKKALLEEEIREHNKEQILSSKKYYVLDQLVPTDIVVVGKSKCENVDGERDENYAICLEVMFTDGSSTTEHVSFSTGTHDWEQEEIAFSPGNKCIKNVSIYPKFHDHSGKVWFDGFGCFENQRPTNLIQFVQNPSFEEEEGSNVDKVAFWASTKGSYLRNSDEHCMNGDWSVQLKENSALHNHVNIYQATAAPLFVEGWSKAKDVSGDKDNGYSIFADITFSDGSVEKGKYATFSTGTHDWERIAFVFSSDKPVKEMDLYCKFDGHQGKVFFDHVTVCQEEFRQYVLNPSFESKHPSIKELANHWEPEGRGYKKNFKEFTIYGHTSIEMNNESDKDSSVAKQVVKVNQKKANKVTVEAYSKADNVNGASDEGYSVKAEVSFNSGKKKTFFAAFTVGTHDWEQQEIEIEPPEDDPIKEVALTAEFKNHTGRVFFDNLTINEEYLFDESELFMMQAILKEGAHNQREEKDWLDEMTELKKRMLIELRKNHQLERELSVIDNKIALLIKNRLDVQEVLKARKRFLKIFRKRRDSVVQNQQQSATISYIKKKASLYQNLFYLLQTEPKYLAQIIYKISIGQMESFLDTVILTLFGDQYSPREEYLLLQLLREATEKEIKTYSDVGGFLEANSIIARMIVTYNRRELGQEYLVKTLAPILQRLIQLQDLDLEISPQKIQHAMIIEEEVRTGEKSKHSKATSDEEALKNPEVKKVFEEHKQKLSEICGWFFDAITSSLNQLPYGLRWICKAIVEISQKHFKNPPQEQVFKIIGYFVYYRFFNPAVVSPDLYNIIRLNLSNVQRKNLVQVSKVLQSLFNFASGTQMDSFIKSNTARLNDYLTKLVDVPEPSDSLMVDQYVELTQGTKPVIVISYSEVYSTHELIVNNLATVAPKKDDPMRIIINELGTLPDYDLVDDDVQREMQLTLLNRFSEQVEEKTLKSSDDEDTLESKTRDLFIELLTNLPLHTASSNLIDLLGFSKQFSDKDPKVKELTKKIDANLQELSKQSGKSTKDVCSDLMGLIRSYVDNQANIRLQKRNILKRLRLGLENLLKSQQFMEEQMESFNIYLRSATEKQHVKKKKGKKGSQPVKFSYAKLAKQGIIVSCNVPEKSKKGTSFSIRAGEDPNEFFVKAKFAGITVDEIVLKLDELLEKQSQGIELLELDDITLNVNLTISMINKTFLRK